MQENSYHKRIKAFLDNTQAKYNHIIYTNKCHTVLEASKSAGEDIENFVKNICLLDEQKNLIVAILLAKNRANLKKISAIVNAKKLNMVPFTEVERYTSYPAGGVPSFGFDAKFLVDKDVLNRSFIITGGGDEYSLIKIATKEIVKLNSATVCEIKEV